MPKQVEPDFPGYLQSLGTLPWKFILEQYQSLDNFAKYVTTSTGMIF